MYEVILFHGPRHSGKTAYYWQHLAGTHARVSAGDVYKKNPAANLHVVIKHFINTLKQKRQVVVDDENWSAETRKSYLRAISKQEFADGCKVSCFQFSPYHSKQQCLWTAQWVLASQEAWLVNRTCSRLSHTEDKSIPSNVSTIDVHIPDYVNTTGVIYKSFTSNSSVKPSKAEGFAEVHNFETHLMCISEHEFTLPALLIQWECLVGVAGTAVVEACYHWQTANREGRIIIVSNSQNNTPDEKKETMQLVCKLLEKHPHLVVYYIIFAGTLSHMIAWLQFRHTISLYHSATVYVSSSDAHRDCAKSLGIINMNIDHISSKPKVITCLHHSTDTPPLMLKKFSYCCPDVQQCSRMMLDSGIYEDTYMNTWTSTGASRNGTKDTPKNYHLPLFELAHTLHQSNTSMDTLSFSFDSKKKQCSVASDTSTTGWHHVISDVDNCCTHGLLYKNWRELCQYHQHTVDKVVIVTNKNCSTSFTRKSWNDSMKEKDKKVVAAAYVSSPLMPAKKHKPTSLLSPRNSRSSSRRMTALPVIAHEELLAHAADGNTYARAEGCQDNVFDVNCTPNSDDEFVVSCQCHGTGVHPYKSDCRVSSSGVIVDSSCSCPIGSSNGGKCKHVIAMLLVFRKQQQVSKVVPRPLPGVTVTGTLNEEKGVGALTRNRSLPKWVSETLPPTEDEGPPAKKSKRTINDNRSTRYKLTDEDLMKTALEILEEPDCIADTEQESSQVMMPLTVEPPLRSCDSSPLMPADDSDNDERTDGIASPMSQLVDDIVTQEIDNAAVDISSDHRYDNTDELGEKIESSLIYNGGDEGQTFIADLPRHPLPPMPIHDKTHDNYDGHCDKPDNDSVNLLDELFS